MSHTPGPWAVFPKPHDDKERFSHWIYEENDPGHNVGICLCEDREESEANASLIAAAPDMLAALKECALQLEYLAEKFQPTSTGVAVLSRVEAAIAKAEPNDRR